MKMRDFFGAAALCAVLRLLAACGTSDAGMNANAAPPQNNDALPPGDVPRGKALTDKNSCTACHGVDYSGADFYPNITSDKVDGIGAWTDAQVAVAIRDGMDNHGATLCSLMERFPFSDQDTADVIAFLRTLAPVARLTGQVCPGHGK